jgi:hypothetical protein
MFLFSVSFRFFLSSEPLGNNITAESQLYRAARVRWPRRRRQWTHSRTYLTVPCSAARFRMFRRAAVRNVQPWGQRTSLGRAAKTDGRLRDFFLMTNVSWPCQSRLFSNPPPTPVNQLWTNSRSLLCCQDESNQICGTAATRIWLFWHICDA